MIDQHASLTEKFLKKGFWLYFFWYIIAPLWYIIKIIVSWELEVEEVWILYWILSLYVLLSSFNDFGMTESMNYFVPKYSAKQEYSKIKTIIAFSFFTQFITGIIIAGFLYFGAEFLAQNYFKSEKSLEVLQIFSLFFLWMNIFRVIVTFFIAIQNTFFNKLIEFLKVVFTLLSVIYTLFWEVWTLWQYAISWIIWLYFAIFFAVIIFYRKYYKKYLSGEKIILSKEMLNTIFWYAVIVFLWSQAGTILSQIDMQMVIFMLDTTQAWYYTNYLSIVSIPFMLLGPIMYMLFPVFSELYEKKDFAKITKIKQMLQKNFIVLIIACNILFFVFSEMIAFVLFGDKFIESGKILQYSILFLIFNFLLQINFHIFAWIWKVKERLNIILIAIVFNIMMNYILITSIWVYGAALATWLWWILIWILSEIKLDAIYRSKLDIIFLLKNIWIFILIWIISFVYFWTIHESMGRGFWLIFLVCFSLLYFWMILIINKKEVLQLFSEIKKIRR